jgi:hypothetical protein
LPKTFRLSDLHLREVSLVDDPANPFAHVMLAKRALSLPRAVVGITKSGGYAISSYVFGKDWSSPQIEQWLDAKGLEHVPTANAETRVNILSTAAFEKLRVITVGTQLRKALLGGLSFDALRTRLQDAIVATYPASTQTDSGCYPGPWITELYADSVIFEQDTELWRVDYTVTDSGDVRISPRVAVERTYREKSAAKLPVPDNSLECAAERLQKLELTARVTALQTKVKGTL